LSATEDYDEYFDYVGRGTTIYGAGIT